MPTYPYCCDTCDTHFEVVKPVAELERQEVCSACGGIGKRYISRTHFYGASDWDKAEYNPGLGCVTRNAKHRERIAKERGVIEVGNDYREIDTMHRENEKKREEQRERRWAGV